MAIDFSEMNRVTKEFIERNHRKVRTYGLAGDEDFDSDKFQTYGTISRMRNVTPPKPKQFEEKK